MQICLNQFDLVCHIWHATNRICLNQFDLTEGGFRIKVWHFTFSASSGVVIQQYMSDNMQVKVADGQKVWDHELIAPDITYGLWMHLRVIWQTSGMKIYINNKLIAHVVSMLFCIIVY